MTLDKATSSYCLEQAINEACVIFRIREDDPRAARRAYSNFMYQIERARKLEFYLQFKEPSFKKFFQDTFNDPNMNEETFRNLLNIPIRN